MSFLIRAATIDDVPGLERLIADSSRALSREDYSPEQIEAALGTAWGVDTQLIADNTYFVVQCGQHIVACGGWSRRKTLFGSDARADREPALLDPAREPAKIRAFFVHPAWARKGIGRALLERCEAEATAEGFQACELMATLPGRRLYAACGYRAGEPMQYLLEGGLTIEFVPMRKELISV
jgi:GNAT superfamily N-acetyltransferase